VAHIFFSKETTKNTPKQGVIISIGYQELDTNNQNGLNKTGN